MNSSVSVPRLLCSWFGAGWLPRAPGSWGSLAALPLAWLLFRIGGTSALLVASVVLFAVGWWAAEKIVAEDGAEDPGWVVIDEVVGQFLTLLFAPPGLLTYAVGFALFRLFDIKKPWPVNFADERLKGGFGIMADDVLAAVYALAMLTLLQRLGLL
jgi:phosphatidylglycerophosphatase A